VNNSSAQFFLPPNERAFHLSKCAVFERSDFVRCGHREARGDYPRSQVTRVVNASWSGQMSYNFQEPERRALSIKEAAQACGLSRATLYRLIANGKLATLKIGARRLVPMHAIHALLRGGET
jgi:excisionase family DNA binding protein